MRSTATDWQQALSAVHGTIIHGEERITTHELLTRHLVFRLLMSYSTTSTGDAATGMAAPETPQGPRDTQRLLPKAWYAADD